VSDTDKQHLDGERLKRLERELHALEAKALKTLASAQEKVRTLEDKVTKLQREVDAVRALITAHQKRTSK
jgi:uncharacterized protein YlxW (UPF0749 family)